MNDAGQADAVERMKEQCKKEQHIYVRVIGTVREYENVRSIMAQSVRKVSSAHEVTHHMLEVIHSYQKYKLGGNIGGGMGGGMYQPNMPQNIVIDGTGMALKNHGGDSHEELFQTILNVMKTHMTDHSTGLHEQVIFDKMAPNYTKMEIRKAMSDMTNDGLIYSTIDEQHFCNC